MLQKILTAVDGSEHADNASAWAIDLAVKAGAELVLLYVVPHREAPPELRRMAEIEHLVAPAGRRGRGGATPAGPIRPLEEDTVESARVHREVGTRLLEALQRRAKAAGVATVEIRVEEGDSAERILAVAEERGADLIVMGRRGRSDLAGLLLGSVSHKVCQLASCACLTVK